MIRFTRVLIAAISASVLVIGCGTADSDDSDTSVAIGDPVSGGTLHAIQGGEPRSLDPAVLINVWMTNGLIGNALYGTLMINNTETLDIEYTMAEGFDTPDGGSRFTLSLRPGLTFTDGTALDAAAVKFNWDRLRDPATASPSLTQASQVSGTEVIDPVTLEVTMVAPNPHFAHSLVASAMNWIASPTALQQGQSVFNDSPVGAGPFELVSWQRQSVMELKRNPRYWDAPKPYLDRLTLRTVTDTSQRINSIKTGGADIAMEASWASIADADNAGFPTETVPTGGGQFIGMNLRRAPFDDPRARRAVALAVDLDAMNNAVYNGKGTIPETLFPEGSPFYTDTALQSYDKAEAQKLLDELAAEGKPLSFTFLAYSSPENKAVAEALQAQLGTFDNVDAKVEIIDFAAGLPLIAAHDFDMIILSSTIQDPDSSLWNTFHSTSRGNYTGVNDKQLDNALDEGRVAATVEARTAAYEIAQQRLIELNPGVWYTRSAPTVVSGKDVAGIKMYTVGSTLPEELWFVK